MLLKSIIESVRDAIRPDDSRYDMWVGKAPTPKQIRERLQQKLNPKEGIAVDLLLCCFNYYHVLQVRGGM